MTDHKGPWTLHEGMTHMSVRNSETDTLFCDLKNVPGVREDARLIAAAPELLDALKSIMGSDILAAHPVLERMAAEAIKKAEGGE